MMGVASTTGKALSAEKDLASKSSGGFGLKELDDLKISAAFFQVMRNYVESDLTGVSGYVESSGLLKKKSAEKNIWSTSDIKDLFDDLNVVEKKHLVKPKYNARSQIFKNPSAQAGDGEIKSALRKYLRDGNHQFTQNEVLEGASAYSHQVSYTDPDQGSKKPVNRTIDSYIRELQAKYNDPRLGKAEALSYFQKFPAKSQQLVRNKVVEKLVESLFVVRDEVKAKEAGGQSGEETAKKSTARGAGNMMAVVPARGKKLTMRNMVSGLVSKNVTKVSKKAGSVATKVTEAIKREKVLDQRFIKDSALNKVRCFINDMAEFQAAKHS